MTGPGPSRPACPVAPGHGPRRGRWAAPLLLVGVALLLYLPGLGREILRHPLEAKYALAARDMLEGGPWLVARLFGELYPDKPPLLFWTTAGLGWLRGGLIDELTARLPAALAATVTLLVTRRLGADLFGSPAGLVAALVLATGGLFFWYARQGHPDQLLTLGVTLAALGLWRQLGLPERTRRRLGWVALAYAAMGLGVLAKGLLGLLLPLLGATLYLVFTGPVRAVPARLGVGPGLPVFLVVVLAWYAPAVWQEGPGYLRETLLHQHVERYARAWVHHGPWYYYLPEFAAGFFPWSLFVPGALGLAWRARPPRREGGTEGAPLFAAAWLASGFVLFSLSTSKRGAYLLPLYPAAALLVGWIWSQALAGRRHPAVSIPLAALAGGSAVMAAAVLALPRHLVPGRMVDTLLPEALGPRLLTAGLVLAGAGLLAWAWRTRRPRLALGLLVGVLGVLLATVAVIRAPQYEARYPARAFGALVRQHVPAREPVLSLLGDYDFLVAFYLGRSLRPMAGPAELLAVPRPAALHALIDGRDATWSAPRGTEVLAETRLGPKPVRLVRLPPSPP